MKINTLSKKQLSLIAGGKKDPGEEQERTEKNRLEPEADMPQHDVMFVQLMRYFLRDLPMGE